MQAFGVNGTLATVFMTMNVSALALTSLDAVARIARTSFSEFFAQTNDALAIESKAGYMKVLGNPGSPRSLPCFLASPSPLVAMPTSGRSLVLPTSCSAV